MAQVARHDGVVIDVSEGEVTVNMHVVSACSSCEAHEKCAFVDSANKEVNVATSDWRNYAVNDSVVVSVNQGLGLSAVMLAYVLPAVLLVGSLIVTLNLTNSELWAALVPIVVTVLYFLILWRMKNLVQKKFSFSIEKK